MKRQNIRRISKSLLALPWVKEYFPISSDFFGSVDLEVSIFFPSILNETSKDGKFNTFVITTYPCLVKIFSITKMQLLISNSLKLSIVSAWWDRVLDVVEKCTNRPHLICNLKEIQLDNTIPYMEIFNFINCTFNMDPQSCNLLSSHHIFGGHLCGCSQEWWIFKETLKGKMSPIVKPLSTIMESPSWSGKSSMPDLSTISLSGVLPV